VHGLLATVQVAIAVAKASAPASPMLVLYDKSSAVKHRLRAALDPSLLPTPHLLPRLPFSVLVLVLGATNANVMLAVGSLLPPITCTVGFCTGYRHCAIGTGPKHCAIGIGPKHCAIGTGPKHCAIGTGPKHCAIAAAPLAVMWLRRSISVRTRHPMSSTPTQLLQTNERRNTSTEPTSPAAKVLLPTSSVAVLFPPT
jgi:hypothetical protein